MSDDNNNIISGEDSDPKEAEALQEMLNQPAGAQADSSVFDQDIFGSAPPPAPAAPAAEDDDVKIVTPDDFAKLTSTPPPSPSSTPPADAGGFSVNGSSAHEAAAEEAEDWEDDMPEIAMPAGEEEEVHEAEAVEDHEDVEVAEAVEEPEEAADAPDEWELDSPVDESAPIDEAISEAVSQEEDIDIAVEATPVALKAAKAKEGAAAVEQTRELIEKLDGEEEGFLDAGEIRAAVKLVTDLSKRLDDLIARVEQLEARLK